MLSYNDHSIATVSDASVFQKTVFLRVDLNVPLTEFGAVADNFRIIQSLPTITYLRDQGCRVVICSHLGRPNKSIKETLRMKPVADRLEKLLQTEIAYFPDMAYVALAAHIAESPHGSVFLLENIRFNPGEETADDSLGTQLALLADVYVNDAFGAAHRNQASVTVVPQHIPGYAGFLLEKEIKSLSKITTPAKPFIAIIGGSKIEDKIDIIDVFAKHADALLIGGALANTFLRAQGKEIGASLYQEEQIALAKDLLGAYVNKIVLPVDVAVAEDMKAEHADIVDTDVIGPTMRALDIGPKTLELFKAHIKNAQTVVWAGPMGYYESSVFATGSRAIGEMLGECAAFRVAGGGDTAGVIQAFHLEKNFDHISTGGGASLEFLAGKPMPGIDALIKSQEKFGIK